MTTLELAMEKNDQSQLDHWIAELEKDTTQPTPDQNLGRISELVEEINQKDKEIRELEKKLKQKKAERNKLEWESIPEAMDDIGMETFTTTDGFRVSVKDYVHCALTKMDSNKKAQMYQWLIENGHGEIIKTNLAYTVGRGEYQQALQIQDAVEKHFGVKGALDQSVHTRTLDKWVREMRESGRQFPEDVFNLTIGRRAKIEETK